MPSSADLPLCHETWTDTPGSPFLGQHQRFAKLPLCEERGDHYCVPRAMHAVAWFQQALVHTKGRWARKPFILADWQREDIIEPLFGNVRWDEDAEVYVRSYSMGWIEVARKNGKSEMLAGIALYLLIMDGEEGAEVYGAARDRDQARIVWDTAERMITLSPVLQRMAPRLGLRTMSSTKRIVCAAHGSFYTTVARDALGNLGQNPHGIVFDEIIAQPDDRLWNSMRTAMGARTQPMMVAATTAGDDLSSFAHNEHNENVRVLDDETRAKHRFAYIRNLPHDADPWDESLWPQANPALGDYLSISALRQEAEEAKNDPSKENAFRQFRLNQWVNQATRWMPMHLFDKCEGEPWLRPDWRKEALAGREAWIGLDLSARSDLTAMATLLVPKVKGDPVDVVFRFWLPEDVLPSLDAATSGQASVWVRDGWLTLHDGAVIDYHRLVEDITTTLSDFRPREITYDKWSGEPVRQALEASLGGVTLIPNEPTFSGMTGPMTELMNLTTDESWHHPNNPVARWCFDSVEIKRATENPDLIKPVKPARAAGGKRIDGVVAAALAVGSWRARGAVPVKRRAVYGFR